MADKRKTRKPRSVARARRSRPSEARADDATGRSLEWSGRPPAAAGKPQAVADWIVREIKEQERRYRKIVSEMNALESRRQRWIRDFYRRIQDTGFFLHADIKRRIRPEAIPPLPKKVRVVF